MMYNKNFIVVVKCNGSILRERDDTVYLPFGSEYSILLKNKDARRALVEIEVDGENVLNGHKLVINGNESQEIKGFMKNMNKTNKFKFINKTEEIQEHRGDRIDDGMVRVTYQFEQTWSYHQPYTITYTTPAVCDDIKFTYGSISRNGTACYSCSSSNIQSSNNCSAPISNEGITVKGELTDQNYTQTNIGQLEAEINTIVLQLKGQTSENTVVKTPLTVKTKIICETCGRKNKSFNKYCFNCGTYLN